MLTDVLVPRFVVPISDVVPNVSRLVVPNSSITFVVSNADDDTDDDEDDDDDDDDDEDDDDDDVDDVRSVISVFIKNLFK